MFGQGNFGIPGFTSAQFSEVAELFWGGDASRIEIVTKPGTVSSAAVDAGNTPTGAIRKGMLLGRIAASGQHIPWDPVATDGSQELDAVLSFEVLNFDGLNAPTRRNPPLIVSAPLRASALLILGSAFVGHAAEYLARRRLRDLGCRLDDDPNHLKAGLPRQRTVTGNTAVVADDNGTLFLADTAAVTFTLPAIRAGLEFEFLRVSSHNLVVTSAEGDNIIVGNDMQADSITFATASQLIGARVKVRSIYVGSALRWLAEIPVTPFGTGSFLTIGLAT